MNLIQLSAWSQPRGRQAAKADQLERELNRRECATMPAPVENFLSVQALRCEPCNYVRRLAINPHTSRMSTAPTMLPMKPAP